MTNKITNGERYKTPDERAKAFLRHCTAHKRCDGCVFKDKFSNPLMCSFAWLNLEAKTEEPLPCPFCGGECKVSHEWNGKRRVAFVKCASERMCWYSSGTKDTAADAIAAHNRFAKAAKDKVTK